MKPARTDRLKSEYRREISRIIEGPLKDREPNLKGLISVTEADVAADLKTAKIYVSIYGTSKEEQENTFGVLKENAGFIRRELAKVMEMRTVPALTFLEDPSLEYGSKMDALFEQLNHKEGDGE